MSAPELVKQGFEALARGNTEEAVRRSSDAMSLAPGSVQVRILAGEVAIARQDLAAAFEHFDAASRLLPTDPSITYSKAQVLVMQRRGLQAQELVAAMAAASPNDLRAQVFAAIIFRDCDSHQGAEPFLLRAKELGADDDAFLFLQAQNLFYLGRLEEAETVVDQLLERSPGLGQAQLLRSRLRTQTPERNHVKSLQELRARAMPPLSGAQVRYALFKELEDLGRYDEAFAVLKEGAEMRRRVLRYQAGDDLKNLSDMIAAFTPSAHASIPDGYDTDAPIFILGLPRTGTTLVERILRAHDGVASAGETNDFARAMAETINQHLASARDAGLSPLTAAFRVDYRKMGKAYVEYISGMIGAKRRFIDKTPYNSLYCGLIGKALPRAPIIHLVRDPMDTCFAVYKTFFNQAYSYSYDLTELAEYYIKHRHLMAHWHSLIPGKILDVEYERLVADPETESRRIAAFCGLIWTPEMVKIEARNAPSSTASAAQIRRPIYRDSVGNWRRYERQLAPLHERLSQAGLV